MHTVKGQPSSALEVKRQTQGGIPAVEYSRADYESRAADFLSALVCYSTFFLSSSTPLPAFSLFFNINVFVT